MTDNMDKLLFDIGREANGKVDFSATLSALLKEQEKQRKRKVMMYRYGGAAAAALVAIIGISTLLPSMGKAESEAAQAPESREYAVMEAAIAADEAMEETAAYSIEEEAVEECAPAEAPMPEEGSVAGITEYPAEEIPASDGAPLAPAGGTVDAEDIIRSGVTVMYFEGIPYVAINPAFADAAALSRLGLPAEITPDMVGDEIGSAAAEENGEPFPVYACPGVDVSGVLIVGGDSFLLPESVYFG